MSSPKFTWSSKKIAQRLEGRALRNTKCRLANRGEAVGDWDSATRLQTGVEHSEHHNEFASWEVTKEEIQKEIVERKNKDWPWQGLPPKLVLQAPFAPNETNIGTGRSGNCCAPYAWNKAYIGSGNPGFRLPTAAQTCLLLIENSPAAHLVIDVLFTYHGIASKFAATCQTAFNVVSRHIDHWDISRHDFNKCERSVETEDDEWTTVGKVVVVTPFRNNEIQPGDLMHEMIGMHKLTRALHRFAEYLQVLHLHRVPFLTPKVLSLVIPAMRKLRSLGIYRCELIHVGHTLDLLNIIRSERGAGKTTDIRLDFYPRYHIGPKTAEEGYIASYCITWDNFKLDTRLATWKIIAEAIRQAEQQGVDLTSHSSAFYLWMSKTPLWRVEETINAILHETDPRMLATRLDFPHTRGHISALPHGENWCSQEYWCEGCNHMVLGIFYDWTEYYEVNHVYHGAFGMTCLGCKLTQYLNGEKDHWKFVKNMLVEHWLKGNTDDTLKALSKENTNMALRAVKMKVQAIEKETAKVLKKQNALWMQEFPPMVKFPLKSPDLMMREPEDPRW